MSPNTKYFIFTLTSAILFALPLPAQEVISLPHCACEYRADQLTPEPEGIFENTCSGQTVEKGAYSQGKKQGKWTVYSLKGKLIRSIHYLNGQQDGQVELFFLSGKTKLKGQFTKGKKTGTWSYYNAKGKPIIEGKYEAGKPVGTWSVYDKKGKKAILQYNYDTSTYLQKGAVSFFGDEDILQNSNTEQYYILRVPEKDYSKDAQPLGGYKLYNDLFTEYAEIPVNLWDTYLYRNYELEVEITDNQETRIIARFVENVKNRNAQDLTFLVVTNPTEKIKKIDHSDFSMQLLDEKIQETLLLLPPWIKGKQNSFKLNLHYVINQNLH